MKRFLQQWLFDYDMASSDQVKALLKTLESQKVVYSNYWNDTSRRIERLSERIDTLERAFASEQQENGKLVQELQQKLEMPKRRGPSGRPWAVVQKLAEMGARRER